MADPEDDHSIFFENNDDPSSATVADTSKELPPPPRSDTLDDMPTDPTTQTSAAAEKRLTNLDIVNDCDDFPYHASSPQQHTSLTSTYYHLLLPAPHTRTLGLVPPTVTSCLRNLPAWDIDDEAKTLTLTAGEDKKTRSDAVAATTLAMRELGFFKVLEGWRDELYEVWDENGEVAFEIERSASALFGVVTYGVHMTGYVRTVGTGKEEEPASEEASMKIWVPRRSSTKSTYPSMLDNTVAGGISAGEDPFTSLLRESTEEASLPPALVKSHAKPTGTVSYFHVRDPRAGGETGLMQPECQFVYDIELPADLELKPSDDEVAGFELLEVGEVRERLARGEFKPNCAMVLLDFFVRWGFINPGNERDFVEVVGRLHRVLEMPTMKMTL